MLHAFAQACLSHTFKPPKHCNPSSVINVSNSQSCNKSIHQALAATGARQHIYHVDYVGLIRQCTRDESLCDGRRIHAIIVEKGDEQDTLVMNLVVQMYGRCNVLPDARATFQGMDHRNVFSWTIMIGAYAQCRSEREALELFRSMEPAGITPNKVTFLTVISLCATMADLAEGKALHSYIEVSPFVSDVKVCNALVNMYNKCGSVEDACLVFEKLVERNTVTWNALITAHAQHGGGKEALQLFQQMQLEAVFPDNVTFINTLDVYAIQTSFVECKRMHARIVASRFEPDVVLGTAIVCMYAKCGSLAFALIIFNDMPVTNTITWNVMLAAFEVRGNFQDVVQLFHQMLSENVIPNKVSSVTIFSACASSQEGLREGKRLHAHALHNVFDWDAILWNALVNMYGKGGDLKEALRLLEETPTQDASSWTSVIAAHGQHNHEQEAFQFFQQMQLECVMPNKATFVSIIDACANNKMDVIEGKHVHARIVSMGFENDAVRRKANEPEDNGYWEHAQSFCNRGLERKIMALQAGELEAVRSSGGVQIERASNAGEAFFTSKMRFGHLVSVESKAICMLTNVRKTESNLVVGNALVNMYGKCQNLDAARRVFDEMPRRDVISWTAIIAAYAQLGYGNVALGFFVQMQDEGVIPNKVTFISALDAFSNQVALVEGQLIYYYLVTMAYEMDMEVGNAAMSMYGKCGSLEDAQKVFDRMEKRNAFSWTVLISTHSHHGRGKRAYKLYREMLQAGVVPTSITYVSVLSACSHAGLVDEGCRCFDSMKHVYGVSPTLEHYNCMVDLLSRAGKLEEGIRMIHEMPMGPTVTTWMTLLGACKMHPNVARALFIADKIFELEPKNATPYVLLLNIFSAAGRSDDVAQIREMMASKGLKKPRGCSSIIIAGKAHEFLTGDRSHSQMEAICTELERIFEQMKREGDASSGSLVQQVEEEEEEEGEKEEAAGKLFHSEKLAVAFGLIKLPPFSPLILTKNLRICLDCHSTMKYISKVAQRQIIIQDNYRSHCFKQGMCSCADCW